jgi:uncharacterized membrane protein
MRALFNSLGAMIASRRRLFAAACIGMAAGFILPASLASQTRAIIGWDVLVTVYLILIGWLFSTQKTDRMAANAAAQMEGEWTIFWIILAAVAGVRSFHIALVCFTLLASWLMTHTVFAMRYAHEYYEISPGNTEIDRGLEFPSDALPDYWDFFYFALVLGMTFQVSDVQITSRALRRLATAHGLLGFLFNTVIIALTVNIGASLL